MPDGNRSMTDLRFGANDALGECGGCGEEGPRYLLRSEAADFPQRERNARFRCQSRIATGEDQPKLIVLHCFTYFLERVDDVGTSFMEHYTYDLSRGDTKVPGAHMLEVCESIAAQKPSLQIHLLSIGGKPDPVRLVFEAAGGQGRVGVEAGSEDRGRLTLPSRDTARRPGSMYQETIPSIRLAGTGKITTPSTPFFKIRRFLLSHS